MIMRKMIDHVQSLGAKAIFINPGQIVFDERVRFKCFIPRCKDYNRCLVCPPHIPSVAECAQIVRKYQFGLIVQVCMEYPAGHDDVTKLQLQLHHLINDLEKMAYTLGFHLPLGLIGGSCKLCPDCVNAEEACRHPYQARPSMEALGIDVIATTAKIGMPVSFPVQDKMCWTGLLLFDEKPGGKYD